MQYEEYVTSRDAAGTLIGDEIFVFLQGGVAVQGNLDDIVAFVAASIDGGGASYYGQTSGTNTYTVSLTPTLGALTTGVSIRVKFKDASSGASTLNADGLGAKKLYKNPTTQIGNGDITDEQIYEMTYDAALDGGSGGWSIDGYDGTGLGYTPVNKAGDTMSGNLAMGGNKVTSSATPSTGDDLTNKTYVDSVVVGVARTGTAIAFATNNIYGTPTSPITGNLTANQTGAVAGTLSIIIHNDSSTPTLDSNFKLTSGIYVTNKVNIIQCRYLEANYIAYSIITVI